MLISFRYSFRFVSLPALLSMKRNELFVSDSETESEPWKTYVGDGMCMESEYKRAGLLMQMAYLEPSFKRLMSAGCFREGGDCDQ